MMDPEENILDDFKALKEKYNVFVVNVKTIENSIEFVKNMGKLLGAVEKSEIIVADIQKITHDLEIKYRNSQRKKALVLLWKDPYFVPGSNTYIDSVLEACGMNNIFCNDTGYIKINDEQLKTLTPDIIFLPDEPYEFSDDDVIEIKRMFEGKDIEVNVKQISGESLCWYGFRTLMGLKYIDNIISQI